MNYFVRLKNAKAKKKYSFVSGAPPGWEFFTMPPGRKQENIFFYLFSIMKFRYACMNGACITILRVLFRMITERFRPG